MHHIRRIFRYLRHYPRQLTGTVVFNLLHVVFNLSSYVLIIPFVELLFGMSQPPASEPTLAMNQHALTDWMLWNLYQLKDSWGLWRCLLTASAAYLACSLLSNVCRYLGYYCVGPIRQGMIQHLRDDIYHKITILPVSYFSTQRRGDLLSRMSNDLFDIEWSIVTSLLSIAKDPINIILFTGTLLFISPRLFLYFLLVLPPSVLLIVLIGKSLKRNSTKGQRKLGDLFSRLEESVSNIRVIKSFGREQAQRHRFRQANADYTRTMVRVAQRRELSAPLSEVLGTIGLVGILILGGSLVLKGEMLSSVFIFFIIIFARLIPPVQSLVRAYNNLQKGDASAERFFELLDADEKIIEAPDATVMKGFDRSIEYDDVCFAYQRGDEWVPVLDHVSFRIEKGRTIALVGPSGAGKTTLVDLLPRFYDPVSGEIRIDGVPLKQLHIGSLRQQIGLVSQNCILFNDTIAHNIAFGHDHYSDDAVLAAARAAYADPFISALPEGYNTLIGDRGMTLSGGQRQRISIARALLKNPPILILDEATSALDAESEHVVQQALDQLMRGRTSIVIAHRLATIQNADEIWVMDKGRIVQRGTHDSLVHQEGLYRKLVEMQSFAI